MSRQEAIEQYDLALKSGQKYDRTCVNTGKYPYPHALDEIFDESISVGHIELGLLEIPLDRVVGTMSKGRIAAFAGNFMPLLDAQTEYGQKWDPSVRGQP